MAEEYNCWICGSDANLSTADVVSCERCGSYKVSRVAKAKIRKNRTSNFVPKLSGLVSDLNEIENPIKLTGPLIDHASKNKIPSQHERSDRLLAQICKIAEGERQSFGVSDSSLISSSYSNDWGDVFELLEVLEGRGLVVPRVGHHSRLTEIGARHGKKMVQKFQVKAKEEYELIHSGYSKEETSNSSSGKKTSTMTFFTKGPNLNADGSFRKLDNFPRPIAPETDNGSWRLNLNVVPERAVVVSQVTSIKVDDHLSEIDASRLALENLKEALDGFVGSDSEGRSSVTNAQVVPLTEADIELLRALVSAAIEMERSPVLPKTAGEFLSGLLAYLGQAKEILERAGKSTLFWAAIAAISTAIQALSTVVELFAKSATP